MICSLMAIGAFILASCGKNSDSKQATLQIKLTDDPADYEAVYVDLQGLDYNTSDDPAITTGWQPLTLQNLGVIDLLSLKNGNSSSLINQQVPVVGIKQFRLRFGNNNSIVDKGVTHPLIFDGDIAQNGAVFPAIVTLSGGTNSVWIDFDVFNSVRYGTNTGYEMFPMLRTFNPDVTGSIEGTITPMSSRPIVYLGDDTTSVVNHGIYCSAIPTSTGYFKIVGLPAGIYQVSIVNQITSEMKTIRNIPLATKEIKNIGTQTIP